MMTGVSIPRFRNSRSTSRPLIRGSMTSRSTRSNASPAARSSAALAVGAGVDGVALAREAIAQRQHQPWLVLDQQQALHACEPWRLRGRVADRRARPTGSSRGRRQHDGELAARARALRSTTRPPCASTMRLTRLRPRPAPWVCAAMTSASGRTARRCAACSAGAMPMPAIRDRDVDLAPDRAARASRSICRSPPYLMALAIRF